MSLRIFKKNKKTEADFSKLSKALEEIKISSKNEYEGDNFVVEFETFSAYDTGNSKFAEISKNIDEIETESLAEINRLNARIDALNKDIDILTNHADGLDYMVAVGSGILCALIDSFFVGEFNILEANKWGTNKINEFVQFVAKKKSGKDKNLYSSISYLEKNWEIPSDSIYGIFGGATSHHLKDFAHHPTPIGLLFSLLTQFTGKVYGIGQGGIFKVIDLYNPSVKFSNFDLIGKDIPTKITLGVINWFFHMVSDIAGSSGSVRMNSLGTGLPGPIVSLLQETSALPIFKSADGKNSFSLWVAKLWNGTLKDANGNFMPVRFDMRTELGLVHEIGKQAIPVVINECIVRGFYFIRHLVREIKNNKIGSLNDFFSLDWKSILPFKNRTIARMLTISTGTFTAVDLADAAVRSTITSAGNVADFATKFILRVNFVGIARFAVAVVTDVGMGTKRNDLVYERTRLELFREFNNDVIVQCEIGKTKIALENAYEHITKIADDTYCKLADAEMEEEESFDRVKKAREARKKAIKSLLGE